MTQNRPTAAELIDGVKRFLTEKVRPHLSGHTAFDLMVALKSLDIVQRELELGPGFAEAERARLVEILGYEGTVEVLNAELARRLRSGEVRLDDPKIAQHLRETTKAKLAIDQPKYSGYQQARDRD